MKFTIVVDLRTSSRAKRHALRLGVLTLVACASGVARADSKTWEKNETLTAEDLNARFTEIDQKFAGINEVDTATRLASLEARLQVAEDDVTTLAEIAAVPGTIVAYAGQLDGNPGETIDGEPPAHLPPEGWLYCNGSEVARDGAYAALFRAIRLSFGEGDGVDTFNLPDLEGVFLRGFDSTGVVDVGSDDAPVRLFGTLQADEYSSHEHVLTDPGHSHTYSDPGHAHTVTFWQNGCSGGGNTPSYAPHSCPDLPVNTSNSGTNISILNASTNISMQAAGGNETRPKNVAVSYIIRY